MTTHLYPALSCSCPVSLSVSSPVSWTINVLLQPLDPTDTLGPAGEGLWLNVENTTEPTLKNGLAPM